MHIGQTNKLKVLRFTSVGAYLGDENDNDVLLPNKYLTDDLDLDDEIEVYLYRDSEDRIVATTERPYIKLDGFAYLKAKDVSLYGAFMDWGLEKDLLVPFKEQKVRMEIGRYYLVSLKLDHATDRLFGTTKTKKLLLPCEEHFKENDEVDLLICEDTDLGKKVIVNDKYSGLVFKSDITLEIKPGARTKGYVAKVREDGKIDVRFNKAGYEKIDEASDKLYEIILKRGSLSVHDKSSPEDIRDAVSMSKKTFKQAVGKLYKARRITITDSGIELVD